MRLQRPCLPGKRSLFVVPTDQCRKCGICLLSYVSSVNFVSSIPHPSNSSVRRWRHHRLNERDRDAIAPLALFRSVDNIDNRLVHFLFSRSVLLQIFFSFWFQRNERPAISFQFVLCISPNLQKVRSSVGTTSQSQWNPDVALIRFYDFVQTHILGGLYSLGTRLIKYSLSYKLHASQCH